MATGLTLDGNGFAQNGFQPQPIQQQAAPQAPSFGNGFNQKNGPSAVFSGMMPAVNYSPNKYLENQINQFAQTQQVPMSFYERMAKMGGTPTTTGLNMGLLQGQLNNIQNQGASNIGGLLGAYQQMMQNYQNQTPAPNGGAVQGGGTGTGVATGTGTGVATGTGTGVATGTGGILGEDIKLGTELPGYTADHKVGYNDQYGDGTNTKVGDQTYNGGDYKPGTDVVDPNAPKPTSFTYKTPTGQNVFDFHNQVDANGKQITSSLGYNIAQSDNGNYGMVGGIPVLLNEKTGKPITKGNENLQYTLPTGTLSMDILKATPQGVTMKGSNGLTYNQSSDGKTTIPLGKKNEISVEAPPQGVATTVKGAKDADYTYAGLLNGAPVYAGAKGGLLTQTGDLTMPVNKKGVITKGTVTIDMNGTPFTGTSTPQKDGTFLLTDSKTNDKYVYDPEADSYTPYVAPKKGKK